MSSIDLNDLNKESVTLSKFVTNNMGSPLCVLGYKLNPEKLTIGG